MPPHAPAPEGLCCRPIGRRQDQGQGTRPEALGELQGALVEAEPRCVNRLRRGDQPGDAFSGSRRLAAKIRASAMASPARQPMP